MRRLARRSPDDCSGGKTQFIALRNTLTPAGLRSGDKGVVWSDGRIDEGFLRQFGHVGRMENERIGKRVYVGECAGSRSVGRPLNRWNDTVKHCLKRGLDVKQARTMVHAGSVWLRFVRGNAWGVAQGMNP